MVDRYGTGRFGEAECMEPGRHAAVRPVGASTLRVVADARAAASHRDD
jgi:hypothetical protein